MSDTKIAVIRESERIQQGDLDSYIQRICLERTVGEMMALRESARNARAYFAASLIFNAIFEKDIQAINQIVWRIDGVAPKAEDRHNYANIFGDAIDDVLDYDSDDQMQVFETDLCIIAMAKVVIHIALSKSGYNVQKKKDKQTAIDMVLTRTQGKKTEPTKPLLEGRYVMPDWMSLPDSEPSEKSENDSEIGG